MTDLPFPMRRAYELGRARRGLRDALALIPLAAILLGAGRPLVGEPAALVVLASTFGLLRWHGGDGGRGALHGVVAGATALAVPLLLGACGYGCTGGRACPVWCAEVCALGGVAAGVVAGRAIAARPTATFAAGVTAFTIALAALGCVAMGAGVVLGTVGSVLVVEGVYVGATRAWAPPA